MNKNEPNYKRQRNILAIALAALIVSDTIEMLPKGEKNEPIVIPPIEITEPIPTAEAKIIETPVIEPTIDITPILDYYSAFYQRSKDTLQADMSIPFMINSTTAFYVKDINILVMDKTDGSKEASLCVKISYPETQHLYQYCIPAEYIQTSNGTEIQDYFEIIRGSYISLGSETYSTDKDSEIIDPENKYPGFKESVKDYRIYSIVDENELNNAITDISGLGVFGRNANDIVVETNGAVKNRTVGFELSKVLSGYDYGNRRLISLKELEQILIPKCMQYNMQTGEAIIGNQSFNLFNYDNGKVLEK